MLSVSFICYDKKRAKKPQPIGGSKVIYELFNGHTLYHENESRIILDTYVGIRVPPGFVAEVIPNPPIFWYTDLSVQGGSYFIGPGTHDSIKLYLIPIFDLVDNIPGMGESIALIKISPAEEFEIEWDGAEPDKLLKPMPILN